MSITDELRVYTEKQIKWVDMTKVHYRELFRIADRIDAEHEGACAEAYGNGVMSVPIAIDESQWVKLPVDADGVPLRVGDEIEYPNGARDTVRFATISPIGWAVNDRGWKPEAMRHHTPPTVEDVLQEFADRVCNSGHQWGLDAADTIAEYAAKLRLAGDGE